MKKRHSPHSPYREKAKGKETRPGSCENPLRPRACARTREEGARIYREAGAAADELIAILGGNATRDHGTWAWYCNNFNGEIERIIEKAHECASCHRQGEIRNAITAFQHWLQKTYGKGGV